MLFDAIILAGGRSSRLGGAAKAQFSHAGQTLLEHSIAAVCGAAEVVVVGDVPQEQVPARVRVARESPPFGGPAAGIAAGMAALADAAADAAGFTLVLACDMPGAARAVTALLESFPPATQLDGIIAVDGARRQPLAAVYRNTGLRTAILEHGSAAGLTGLPMHRLIEGLDLAPVAVPDSSTADVDTWADAARFGLSAPTRPGARKPIPEGVNMDSRKDDDEALSRWCGRLAEELDTGGLDVDITAILGLAGRAAHAVLRPAAPLTTFLVGYAAGLAAGAAPAPAAGAGEEAVPAGAGEEAVPAGVGEEAVRAATTVVLRLCRDAQEPDDGRPSGQRAD